MIFACGSRPCGHVYPQCELRPGASSGCPPVWTGRLPADRTDPSRLRVRLAHEPLILRRAAPPPGPGGHVPDAAGPAPLPERLGADGRRSGMLGVRHDANADPDAGEVSRGPCRKPQATGVTELTRHLVVPSGGSLAWSPNSERPA